MTSPAFSYETTEVLLAADQFMPPLTRRILLCGTLRVVGRANHARTALMEALEHGGVSVNACTVAPTRADQPLHETWAAMNPIELERRCSVHRLWSSLSLSQSRIMRLANDRLRCSQC